jgi:hypothetical protein
MATGTDTPIAAAMSAAPTLHRLLLVGSRRLTREVDSSSFMVELLWLKRRRQRRGRSFKAAVDLL